MNIVVSNGVRILNIETFGVRILNIEIWGDGILNICPSVVISIFGVVASLARKPNPDFNGSRFVVVVLPLDGAGARERVEKGSPGAQSLAKNGPNIS